ncbi:substrate-binding domain-containing protein [Acidisoma cladoniae]|jgi:fructose transport system substrate-binding protein|uniref:substrate-binding domain-containing protein n=1 Tax=Acidisoma cladoniae TaxID=3040935 RepID=UPI002550BEDA|nr:substrate-binding domain-containing protein [Acidisoma sp. PAMC 29798]
MKRLTRRFSTTSRYRALLASATILCLATSAVAVGIRMARADSPIIVGLVTKTEVNPYFVKLRQAAAAEAKLRGVRLIARAGKFDGDNEGQVAAIESLISAGARGILVTPNNSSGVLNVVKEARAKGIIVIALDTATDPADAVDATFATDNFQAGVQQGEYAKAALAGKAPKLAMLDGTPGGTVDTFRHNGFLKGIGLAEGDPAILGKVITNGQQDKGQTGMENLLSAHPDINVVYTINEPAAEGAFAAIRSAGKTKGIVLTSIDGGCLGVKYVKAGKIWATVMQFPKKMAAEGVDAVVDYAKTGKKPTGFVNTGSDVITGQPMPGVPSQDLTFGVKNCWG